MNGRVGVPAGLRRPGRGPIAALCTGLLLLGVLAAPAAAQERGGRDEGGALPPVALPGDGGAPGSAPPPLAGQDGDAAALEPSVLARRLNGTVTVRDGASREERVLYFFDPTADLAVGDELEQGPSAQSTLSFSEGSLVEMYANGHVVVEELAETGDRLRFVTLTTAEVIAGARPLTIWLPGETRVSQVENKIVVRVEPGRIKVRNDGGQPVEVETLITQVADEPGGSGRETIVIGRGEEVHLPYLRLAPLPLGPLDQPWSGMVLRNVAGLDLERDGERLVVRGERPGQVFTVGGVRTALGGAEELVIQRHRPHFRPAEEPRELPTPAADRELPPQHLQPINLKDYIRARNKGADDATLESMGYWVSPQVREAYDKQMQLAADAAADNTEDTEP